MNTPTLMVREQRTGFNSGLQPLRAKNTFSATGSRQAVPSHQLVGYQKNPCKSSSTPLVPIVDTSRPAPVALAYAIYNPAGDHPSADRMRPGANAHQAHPSRMGDVLRYRDGRTQPATHQPGATP
jgi:hypothetical protein